MRSIAMYQMYISIQNALFFPFFLSYFFGGGFSVYKLGMSLDTLSYLDYYEIFVIRISKCCRSYVTIKWLCHLVRKSQRTKNVNTWDEIRYEIDIMIWSILIAAAKHFVVFIVTQIWYIYWYIFMTLTCTCGLRMFFFFLTIFHLDSKHSLGLKTIIKQKQNK